ncbi:MAG: hypothetical protein ACLQVI_42645 [Polyangiaceae bacterium]
MARFVLPVVLAAGALAAVSCSRSELDFGFNAVPEAPGDGVGEDGVIEDGGTPEAGLADADAE